VIGTVAQADDASSLLLLSLKGGEGGDGPRSLQIPASLGVCPGPRFGLWGKNRPKRRRNKLKK
jgi:hypothetical protein